MSDLTEKFTALEAQIDDDANEAHSQRASILSTLEDIQTGLSNINSDMLLMKSALIQAIGQSAACADCPTSPLIGGTPTDTPTTGNDVFCQRVNAFLAFISLCCDYADALGTLSSAFTPGFVTTTIEEIRVTLSDSGIPIPGWLDTIAIAADGVNFIINRALFGGGARASFDEVKDAIKSTMFVAGSAAGAQAAYISGIDSSTGLSASKPLLKAFAFGDVVNYFLDPSSEPELAAYSGTDCYPSDCITLTSTLTTYPGSVQGQAIWWVSPFTGSNCTPAAYCADGPAWLPADMANWTIIAHSSIDVFGIYNLPATAMVDGDVLVLGSTSYMAIQNYPSTTPFTVTLCPPAEA